MLLQQLMILFSCPGYKNIAQQGGPPLPYKWADSQWVAMRTKNCTLTSKMLSPASIA